MSLSKKVISQSETYDKIFVCINDSPFIGSVKTLIVANYVREGPTTTTSLGDNENQRSIRDSKDTMINRRLDALKSKHADDRCAAMA